MMTTADVATEEPRPRPQTAPAEASLPKRLWYDGLQVLCRLGYCLFFQVRCRGRTHVPAAGNGLVIANHQSHLDPVLIGVAVDRRLNFLARDSLFTFAPLRWLIESLDAIPLDREGSGLGGLKETLRRLKQQKLVLIFAEGTRSPDGELHEFHAGFVPLARRSRAPLIPVGFDGAYQSWPRKWAWPRPGVICLEIGEPLSTEEAARLTDDELLAEMRRRVTACFNAARAQRERALQN